MTRDTTENKQSMRTDDSDLLNLVTIVGRGVPSNFEISVSGEIEMVADDPMEQAVIVSGGVAEGSIETGVQRFRFSGECANIRAVDWNGVPAPESASSPTIHVDYGVSDR
ncbi:hypothetical protein [Natrinema sp. 1APR25-10V2]|uniref:hypothetical protein n=1 Tax=Natrinema sp. 1APR25-10V2 TaxID=2951081 RepID=UPI002874634A|nr:hypothetical protein [Natrinema sp. 1APR25-10V2]MDS0477162.1 hypothetical protein [Natrinema sp. 1APR25-10V2]